MEKGKVNLQLFTNPEGDDLKTFDNTDVKADTVAIEREIVTIKEEDVVGAVASPKNDVEVASKKELEELKKKYDEAIGLLKAITGGKEEAPKEEPKEPEKQKQEIDPVKEYLKKLEGEKLRQEELEKEKLRQQIEQYKIKDVMNQTIQNKPHLAEFLNKKYNEGLINTVKDLEMYTDKEIDEAFKLKAVAKDKTKLSGGDPNSVFGGIILSEGDALEIEREKRAKQYKEEFLKKLGIKQ